MGKINIGLIGCGYWGKNLVDVLQGIKDVSLVYVCDTVQPTLLMPEGTHFVKDYKVILNDASVKGVVISTPTVTHYTIAKEALEMGKDVFVEKPLTTKSNEAKELCEISDKHKLMLMTGEVFRFHSSIHEIKRRIIAGELGNIEYIISQRLGLGPIRPDVSALFDLVTHDIYSANVLMGKLPISVNYSGFSFNNHLDDVVTLNMKYMEDKVFSIINVSWLHPYKVRHTVVVGTKEAISFDDVEVSEKIRVYEKGVSYEPKGGSLGEFQTAVRDGDIIIPNLKFSPPLKEELKEFIREIKDRTYQITNNYDGLDTVRVLEAAEKSRILNGKEVYL